MEVKFFFRLPALMIALVIFPAAARAHQLDEYVQQTLVEIEPDEIRLHIYLTPGREIARQVVSRIDRDGDGFISVEEGAAYVDALMNDLSLSFDDEPAPYDLVGGDFPALAELNSGERFIRLDFALMPRRFSARTHRVRFENRHMRPIGAYLFNVAMPRTNMVKIIAQKRNSDQSEGEIEFEYTPQSKEAVKEDAHNAGLLLVMGAIGVGWIGAVMRGRRRI